MDRATQTRISSFSGLTYTWCISQLENKLNEQEEQKVFKEIDKLRHLIRLRLNPDGTNDKKIEELIEKIPDLTHTSQQNELKQALNELTKTTQSLLKEEWEKVKEESIKGKLRKDKKTICKITHWINAMFRRVLTPKS